MPLPRTATPAGSDRRHGSPSILSDLSGVDPDGPRSYGQLRRPWLRLAVPHPGQRPVPQAVRGADHLPPALRGGAVDRLARRRSSIRKLPRRTPSRSREPRSSAAGTSRPSRQHRRRAGRRAWPPTSTARPDARSPVERLIREQLRIMEQQLELMQVERADRRDGSPAPATALGHRGAARPPRPPAPARPTGHYLATRDQGTPAHRAPRPDRAPAGGHRRARAPLRRPHPGIEASRPAVAAPTRRQPDDRRVRQGVEGARLPDRLASARTARGSGTSTATSTSTRRSGFGTNLFGHSPDFVVDRGPRAARSRLRGRRPERPAGRGRGDGVRA